MFRSIGRRSSFVLKAALMDSLLSGKMQLLLIKCDFVSFRYSGGPPIPRKLICQGFYSRSYSVEVYPLCLMLTDGRDQSLTTIRLGKQVRMPHHFSLNFSLSYLCVEKDSPHWLHGLLVLQASLRELYEKVCAIKSVSQEKVCV